MLRSSLEIGKSAVRSLACHLYSVSAYSRTVYIRIRARMRMKRHVLCHAIARIIRSLFILKYFVRYASVGS